MAEEGLGRSLMTLCWRLQKTFCRRYFRDFFLIFKNVTILTHRYVLKVSGNKQCEISLNMSLNFSLSRVQMSRVFLFTLLGERVKKFSFRPVNREVTAAHSCIIFLYCH